MTTYITPQQLADQLHTSTQTLAQWRATGRYRLPYIKVGRKVLYRPQDVDKWLESRVFENTGEAK